MNVTVQVTLWVLICQWLLLFALGALVIMAYRQLGYFLHLKDLAENVGSEKDGLALGTQAIGFRYTKMHEREKISCSFEPQNSWSLLLFVDPGCVSCQNVLHALERLAPQLSEKMRLLIITSAEPAFLRASEDFRSTNLEMGHVEKEVIYKLYRTNTTPFLYIIDQKGVIQAKGVVENESGIKKIIRKVDISPNHGPLVPNFPS